MNVLVAYASKYGSTRAIAERIALELTQSGRAAEAAAVTTALDLGKYDAFVIGSAVFYGKWMKEAVDFVRDNASLIKGRPIWLFSSGPLGDRTKGGRDQRETAVPIEIPELERFVRARGHRVFFGRLERRTLGRLDGFVANVMGIQGDFRDWTEISDWAREIAHALEEVAA
jgi:menaquinone-dependent protoporphyrinogen oxidase